MALTSSLFSSDLKISCFSNKRHIGEAQRGWDNIIKAFFFLSFFSLGERATQPLGMVHVAE
jgi:hypothetical protein